MSDSPSRRLVKLLSEGAAEGWYAHMAVRMYDLLEEAYEAGWERGGWDYWGRYSGRDQQPPSFEEWMSLDGE